MQQFPYWQQQYIGKPLFPEIEWNKPEQRTRAGKLAIIGGNKLSFVAVGNAYSLALEVGTGQVRILLPDILKKVVPPTIPDVIFGASNPSGGLSKDAASEIRAIGQWADGVLLIGDAGGNSETAILYEDFVSSYKGLLTLTRDSIDLLHNSSQVVLNRPDTMIVISFAQLQKLFRSAYYPKMIVFSMQLQQLVETLHKFTVTYPITITTYHQDHIIVAHDGNVTTTQWEHPMQIWKGNVATKIASYWLWNPVKPLESATTSIAE